MKRIAVIGFGCAAFRGIEAMRLGGCTDEIHVFAPVKTPPENPMLTTYYAAGRIAAPARYPFGTPQSLAERYDLKLHLGVPVKQLDIKGKNIICADGGTHTFDKLLIASGATAFLPPMEGDAQDSVFPMRTMADAQRLKDRLAQGGCLSALVVGASMIGIKAVEIFTNLGISCTLADIAPHIFPLAALECTAAEIERRLVNKGVSLRFGSGLSRVDHLEGGGYAAHFTDGAAMRTDLIVVCVGTRTNLAFLTPGQLPVGRGIIVDDHMRTGVPDIYAAGDCCEGNNLQTGETQVIGLWASAGMQGRTAGRNLAGGNETYNGGIVQNITHFMDMDFVGVGDKRLPGTHVSYLGQNGDLRIEAIIDGGQMRCLNLLGGCRISGVLRNRMQKAICAGARGLSPEELGLLRQNDVPEEFITLLGGIGV